MKMTVETGNASKRHLFVCLFLQLESRPPPRWAQKEAYSEENIKKVVKTISATK